MSADNKDKGVKVLKSVAWYAKVLILKVWYRLMILGRYCLICFTQQRLRRASRQLGRRVLEALEQGEVNPMLADSVKDALNKAQSLKANKDRHYQAIQILREKIRTACTCEFPAPGPEGPTPGGDPSGPQGN